MNANLARRSNRPKVTTFTAAPTRVIQRTVEKTQFQSSLGGATSMALTFALSDLPNYTEFTALFDQYRIEEVSVRLIPIVTTCTPASYTDSLLYSVVDFDDATTATVTDLQQYENVRVSPPTKEVKYRLVPRLAIAAYGGAFTQYANTQMWLDVGSPSTYHYGLKLACSTAGGAVQTWKIVCNYRVALKNVR